MNASLSLATERLVELPGATAGSAAATLVAIAGAQGYTVAATASGTYRLARTRRRMLVGKRTESVVVSIFADRTGTKARIVGPLDDLVVEHLRHAANKTSSRAHPTATSVEPPPPAATSPATPSTAPTAPAPSPTASPLPVSPNANHVEGGPPWRSVPSPVRATDAADQTVARSALQRSSASATLVLPDGRNVALDNPVLVGRNPDPLLGPPAAVPVAIADQSVSKTHVAISVVDGVVWVTDLHSTNGTSVETNGTTSVCVPGQQRRAETGSTIVAGDVRLHVRGAA